MEQIENLKSKRKSVIVLGHKKNDQTHKLIGNSEKNKTRMQSFHENLPKGNYPMYGWLHETFNSSETKPFYISRWDKWFEFKENTGRNCKNHYWFSFRIEIWKISCQYLINYNESRKKYFFFSLITAKRSMQGIWIVVGFF